MSRNVHKRSNTIASGARADYSRFIEPADTEVLDKLGARSFNVEQREKMIAKTFLQLENSPLSWNYSLK